MKPTRSGDVRLPDTVLPLLSRPWRLSRFARLVASIARLARFVSPWRCVVGVYPLGIRPVAGRTLNAASQRAAESYIRRLAGPRYRWQAPAIQAELARELPRWPWALYFVHPTPRNVLSLAYTLGFADDIERVHALARLLSVSPDDLPQGESAPFDSRPIVLHYEFWPEDELSSARQRVTSEPTASDSADDLSAADLATLIDDDEPTEIRALADGESIASAPFADEPTEIRGLADDEPTEVYPALQAERDGE